jgi:diguanylate cyclase (GGDEF)-like protein
MSHVVDLEGVSMFTWRCCEEIFGDRLMWLGLYVPYMRSVALHRFIEVTGSHSVSPQRLMGGEGPINDLFRSTCRVSVAGPEIAERLGEQAPIALSHGIESVVVVPLPQTQSSVQGGMLIGLSEPLAFAPGDLRRHRLRRMQVALARQLDRIESQELQTRSQHTVLGLVGLLGQFGAHHQTPQITEKSLEYMLAELGFRQALLTLVDDEARTIYGIDARGGLEDVCRLVRSQWDGEPDIFNLVFRANRTMVFEGSPNDPRIPQFLRNREISRMMLLPMRVEHQVVGILLAEYPAAMASFHLERSSLYQHVADLVGQSLYLSTIYEKLRRTAETDPLTGCFNRLALNAILEEEIPRVKRSNRPLSLVMVDLCDFKKFNDLYSHVVGDRILKTVARLLQECTRKSDKVVRYGGDEFLIVMPNTNEMQAQAVLERIENAVAENNDRATSEQEIFMLSLGLKSATRDNVDRVVEEADEMMYRRKAEQSRTKLFNAFTSNNPDDLRKSDSFVAVLIKNLSQREPHFLEHARRVMLYSQAICQRIGADEELIERASLSALLHDIGKIALPIGLLTKPGPLTPEDRRQIRMHPTAGSDFLAGHKYLSDLRIIINHHHERWDGMTTGPHPGYPSGLAGEQIPLCSRIIRVAEMYDDLTSPRPWRPNPYSVQQAIEIMQAEAGHMLDPTLTAVFIDYLEMIHTPLADFAVRWGA